MIIPPCPRHWGQVELILKKPLDCVTWPRPWQRLQTCGEVPGAQPDPRQEEQRIVFLQIDLGGGAEGGVHEGDPQIVAQIGARPGRRARAGTSRVEAEDIAEDVAEARKDVFETGKAPVAGAVQPFMAVPVVDIPFFRVAQDLVGLGRLLELLLRFLVSRIPVRMVLHGELAIALFYLVFRGVSLHAQDLDSNRVLSSFDLSNSFRVVIFPISSSMCSLIDRTISRIPHDIGLMRLQAAADAH